MTSFDWRDLLTRRRLLHFNFSRSCFRVAGSVRSRMGRSRSRTRSPSRHKHSRKHKRRRSRSRSRDRDRERGSIHKSKRRSRSPSRDKDSKRRRLVHITSHCKIQFSHCLTANQCQDFLTRKTRWSSKNGKSKYLDLKRR